MFYYKQVFSKVITINKQKFKEYKLQISRYINTGKHIANIKNKGNSVEILPPLL